MISLEGLWAHDILVALQVNEDLEKEEMERQMEAEGRWTGRYPGAGISFADMRHYLLEGLREVIRSGKPNG